jgi:hypothetical protein
MTITLTPKDGSPQDVRVTPDMVALYRRAKRIKESGLQERWEVEGGHRGEYIDTVRRLMRLLGMWQPWRGYLDGPLDDLDPPCPPDHPSYDDWLEAVAAREALEAALPRVL